jgi:hypothetical protein
MAEITEDKLRKIVADVNAKQRLPTMALSAIDEMEARKHDLDFQSALCTEMMRKGEFLPFAFDRAAVLLRKARRYDAERIICASTPRSGLSGARRSIKAARCCGSVRR